MSRQQLRILTICFPNSKMCCKVGVLCVKCGKLICF